MELSAVDYPSFTPCVDFYATEYYYIDHMVSIYQALPEANRGMWWTTEEHAFRLKDYNIQGPTKVYRDRRELRARLRSYPSKAPTLTASYANCKDVLSAGRPAPTIIHGQGGAGATNERWRTLADRIPLIIVPAEYGTQEMEGLKMVLVDGQPKLDRHFGVRPQNPNPTIAISFRWREVRSAFEYYAPHMEEFIEKARTEGWRVIGHGHPLAFETRFRPFWKKLGVERTADFEKVLRMADLYIVDCSSSTFEFASLERPVVILNAPCYQERDRGPRYSEKTVGLECPDPQSLFQTVKLALLDPAHVRAERERIVKMMFGEVDGQSSIRAAEALVQAFSVHYND